jgi:UDP-N-acetylmuramoyl-tripeptide--D-alanyl-D-alanine ligase
MGELGAGSAAAHLSVAEQARDLGVEVIAVDAPDYGESARHVPDIDSAVAALADLEAGDAVLVKASRAAALERVAQALLG